LTSYSKRAQYRYELRIKLTFEQTVKSKNLGKKLQSRAKSGSKITGVERVKTFMLNTCMKGKGP
jgi:hypothetical protein